MGGGCGARGHAELIHHLLGDFAEGAEFGVYEDVGLAIELFSFGEELADFGEGIRFIQEGAMGLVFNAVQDFFRRSPETHGQRMCFEAGHVLFIEGQAAAGGDDGFVAALEFFDNATFHGAKSGFALVLEDVGDGGAGTGFDDVVGIKEGEVEGGSDLPADGGFTRAHEANQREIADVTGTVHGERMRENGRNGTYERQQKFQIPTSKLQ